MSDFKGLLSVDQTDLKLLLINLYFDLNNFQILSIWLHLEKNTKI